MLLLWQVNDPGKHIGGMLQEFHLGEAMPIPGVEISNWRVGKCVHMLEV